MRCTVGDNTTCAKGGNPQCVAIAPNFDICVGGCATDGDCRAAEGYVCYGAMPGKAGVCVYPHANPGASCAKDTECGPAGSPWRCIKGPFTNGYCSGIGCNPADPRTCPLSSHCADPTPAKPLSGDEFCAKDCATDTECRSAEGYTCKPFDPNNLSLKVCLP